MFRRILILHKEEYLIFLHYFKVPKYHRQMANIITKCELFIKIMTDCLQKNS